MACRGGESPKRRRLVAPPPAAARRARLAPPLPCCNLAAQVVDCSDKVIIPGMVNTHHHM